MLTHSFTWMMIWAVPFGNPLQRAKHPRLSPSCCMDAVACGHHCCDCM